MVGRSLGDARSIRKMAFVSRYEGPFYSVIWNLSMKYHVYKDANNEWRWRLKAANGNILADSGEGYSAKADYLAGIAAVKGSAGADIEGG